MKKDKKYKEMEKKAEKPVILFSFDGTVMNTEPAVIATYRHVLAEYDPKKAMSPDQILPYLDKPVAEAMQTILPDEDQDKLLDEYNNWQMNHLINLIQPMPGIEDLLIWLKKKQYKIGLVSTRTRDSVVELLKNAQLIQYFDTIIGSKKINSSHVHLDAILEACHLLTAERCIFIGSSPADLDAAIRAGAYTIGYAAHTERSRQIIEMNPDFVTADFKEIRKLLSGEALWLAYELYDPDHPAENKKKKKKEKKHA